MKPESKETSNDEAKESVEEQNKEEASGTEEHDKNVIPEEFQNKVNSLISEYCDHEPCLSYLSDRAYKAKDELRMKEQAAKNKGKKSIPNEYSVADMPAD